MNYMYSKIIPINTTTPKKNRPKKATLMEKSKCNEETRTKKFFHKIGLYCAKILKCKNLYIWYCHIRIDLYNKDVIKCVIFYHILTAKK